MHEFLAAGFGGQGVLVMGQLLATAGMLEGTGVTWFPSYGPEQRGGTCNCSVVLNDGEVGSPMVHSPDAAVLMNLPSLQRFEPTIKPSGLLLYNSSLIEAKPNRTDVKIVAVPATDIADELGNARIANLVLLGAYVASSQIVEPESIEQSLAAVLPKRHHGLIPLNMEAFNKGMQYKA